MKMKINMNNMIGMIKSSQKDSITRKNVDKSSINLINNFTNMDCDKALVGFIDIMGMAKLMTCGKDLHASSLLCISERYTDRCIEGPSNKNKKTKKSSPISKICDLVPFYNIRHLRRFEKTEDNFRAVVERKCVLCGKPCYSDLSVYGILAHGKCLHKISTSITSVGISKSMVPYLSIPHIVRQDSCIMVLDTVLDSFMENNTVEIEYARKMIKFEKDLHMNMVEQDRLEYIKGIESRVNMKFYKWKKTLSKEFSRSALIWISPGECMIGLDISNSVQNPLRLQYGLSVGRTEKLTVNKFCKQMLMWDRLSA